MTGISQSTKILLGCSIVLACAALAPVAAHGQVPSAPLPDRAAFAVRLIEATHAPAPSVDPRLKDMARELQSFQKFNKFAIVGEQVVQLGVGARSTLKLPDGRDFAIQLLGFTPGKVVRARHVLELLGAKMTRAVAPGARTLDVVPGTDKLTIVSTMVTLPVH